MTRQITHETKEKLETELITNLILIQQWKN